MSNSKSKQLKNLIQQLLEIQTEENMRSFLVSIFTPAELEEFPKRLEIIKMLKKGIPHHEVAKKLGVGVATVTRGSREIKRGNFGTVKPG